jgi:DNA-binding beta-propeller fold protein YncE
VAIGPQDEVVVLSRDAGGVCVFELDGREKTLCGSPGAKDGQLNKPSDVACDAAGSIYVADTDNDRIAVFKATGEFVANVGSGKLTKPVSVTVDAQGNLYVLQDKKPGVLKIAKAGEAYGEPTLLAESVSQPLSIACDATGRVYVSQNADPGLVVVGADGKTVVTLAKWGEESLRGLPGLAFDRRGFLVCSRGERGGVLRIPIGDIR